MSGTRDKAGHSGTMSRSEAGGSGTDGTHAYRHVPCPAPSGQVEGEEAGHVQIGPNSRVGGDPGVRGSGLSSRALDFIRSLRVPEGPLHGQPFSIAPFQVAFIEGVLRDDVMTAILSVGRGQGKSMLAAALALAHVMGVSDGQPRRQIIIAARVKEQARISWEYVQAIVQLMEPEEQSRFTFRQAPRLEISYSGSGGGMIRAVAADAKNLLGLSPTLVIEDEFGHWNPEKGMALHSALETAAGKRRAKMVIISTSASNDTHPLSQMLDNPPPYSFIMECRAPLGVAADDLEGLRTANPGSEYGIGPSLEWLQAQARVAIQRGGQALSGFRLYSLNQRISDENTSVLFTTDEWLACECSEADLPAREGLAVLGIDLGGSRSMSAAVLHFPETGRTEALGTFPRNPGLAARGEMDGVKDRYVQMHARGELSVSGDATVQIGPWLREVWDTLVRDADVRALTCDRYRQGELADALRAAGLTRVPVVFRGQGYRDGGQDVEAARKAVFDGKVRTMPSLLLRSAAADACVVHDDAMNAKLTKSRSTGRIDAMSALVLAVAEGQRMMARPAPKGRVAWV